MLPKPKPPVPATNAPARAKSHRGKSLFFSSLAIPIVVLAIAVATGHDSSVWIGLFIWLGFFLAIASPLVSQGEDELRFWKAIGAAIIYILVTALSALTAFLLTGGGVICSSHG
jgi:hypothetical protein